MRISVHTTDRTQFKWCRQRWDFASNLRMNLEPRATITPLWFGTGIHLALANYYDPQFEERSIERARASFNKFCDDWRVERALEGQLDPERETWLKEQRTLGLGMLSNYFGWARKHDAEDFDEVIWVEQVFDIPIPGMPGVSYRFRVDGLVRQSNRIYVLEHKTTAQFAESSEWLSMDDQCGSYLWGIREATGVEADGVIYNSLKKKSPKHLTELSKGGLSINKQQDTTFETALADIRAYYGTHKIPAYYHNYLRYLRDVKEDNFVHREVVRRNRNELNHLGESMRFEVMDMLNNPSIYRSPSRINCGNCPFVAPCIAKWEDADWRAILAANYQERDNDRL